MRHPSTVFPSLPTTGRVARSARALGLACLVALGPAALLATEAEAPAEAPAEPPAPTLSDEERAHVIELLEASRSELEALAARAHGDAWSARPAPESWSPGEVVEHLVLAEEMFLGLITGTLAGEPDPDWAAVAAAGIEGIEASLADRSQRFQAPEVLQPTGEVDRAELLGRFARSRTLVLDLVRTTDAPIKEYLFEGPPGKLNVHQWLTLVGAHNQRHNRQIAEALETLAAGS